MERGRTPGVTGRGYRAGMGKTRVVLTCRECRQQVSQWVGRCPGCGAWGTIDETTSAPARGRSGSSRATLPLLDVDAAATERRVRTGFPDVDRVLGGGLVPASVCLLAGAPGIGKSTLLLHLVAHLASMGHDCLLVSGEESHAQVSARARW